MGRRQYGTGTVYQRADGRWIGRAEAGWTPQGTRRRVSVSGKTEAEAKRKLRDKLRTIHEDEDQIAGKKLTVKTWAEQWYPIHAQRVQPRHAALSKSMAQKWIIPTIGHKKLDSLVPADARALERAILAAGRKPSTAGAVITLLRTMLKDARIEGHKVPDGILQMARPQAGDTERDAIPIPTAAAILREAAKQPDEYARWALAFFQGMRQSEVLGLTWDCIDFDRGLIDVTWQLKFVAGGSEIPRQYTYKHVHANFWLSRPKTKAGQRVIPIAPPVLEALKAWKKVAEPNPWGLVFTAVDRRTGKNNATVPRDHLRDRNLWYDLQKAAKVQKGWTKNADGEDEPVYWHIHEARHAAATLLVTQGVNPAIVAAILGQKALVDAYVHLHAETLRPAIDNMAGLLQAPQATTT